MNPDRREHLSILGKALEVVTSLNNICKAADNSTVIRLPFRLLSLNPGTRTGRIFG